jgi:hypothetical protein
VQMPSLARCRSRAGCGLPVISVDRDHVPNAETTGTQDDRTTRGCVAVRALLASSYADTSACSCRGDLVIAMTVTAAPRRQVDFGEWAPRWEDQPERVPGPELANYLGIPINDAARMVMHGTPQSRRFPRAVPAAHGRLHLRGPSNLRISKEVDPASRTITAFHASGCGRSIAWCLCGQPHPPGRPSHVGCSRPRNGTATS